MALKDWKPSKKTNRKFKEVKWDNKINSTSISIVNDGKRWRVWLTDVFDDQGEELKSSGFNLRSQAMKYAIKYMKSN